MAKKKVAKKKVAKKKGAKNEKTSKRVGKIASQQLRSKSTSKKAKSTAASALTQRPDKKRTPKGTNNTGPRNR